MCCPLGLHHDHLGLAAARWLHMSCLRRNTAPAQHTHTYELTVQSSYRLYSEYNDLEQITPVNGNFFSFIEQNSHLNQPPNAKSTSCK